MDKSKLLKLFIILFKHEMFNYLKEAIYFWGLYLLSLAECFKNFAYSIIYLLYAIFLFAIYPLRPIQLFYNGIKNKKKWATEELYNKHFGDNNESN